MSQRRTVVLLVGMAMALSPWSAVRRRRLPSSKPGCRGRLFGEAEGFTPFVDGVNFLVGRRESFGSAFEFAHIALDFGACDRKDMLGPAFSCRRCERQYRRLHLCV